MTDEEHNQEALYSDYMSNMSGEENMEQNVNVDYELSSGPSEDMSYTIEKVPEENTDDDCYLNMTYEIENISEENEIIDYCITLSDNEEYLDNYGNLSAELPLEPLDNCDNHNELNVRDNLTLTPTECNGHADSIEYPQCTENDTEIQDSHTRNHACFYCGRFYERISIHYLRCHSKRAEVVRVLKTPARSKARKWRWDTLKSKGDSKHEQKEKRNKSGEKIQKKGNFNQESRKNIPDERKTKGGLKGNGTPWSRKEKLAVLKHLGHCVKSGRNPVKKECMDAKAAAPKALKHRTWVMIKHFIRNRRLKLAKKKKEHN